MLGYLNNESLRLTLRTNVVHFYSRTKQRIWKKGEESGNPPQEDPKEAEIRDLQAKANTRRTDRANEVGTKTDEVVPILTLQ